MPYADPVKARECGRACDRRYRAAHPERCREQYRRWQVTHPQYNLLADARRRAKRFGVPYALTAADVRALLAPMRCSATGVPLAHNTGGGCFDALSPSLDRIVPALGYVPGNVRLVCHRFNVARNTADASQDFANALRVLAETSHADDSAITRNPYQ